MTLAPQITFRNMETSGKLEEVVLKEAEKLDRFFSRIVSCRVTIEGPRRQEYGGLFRVRIDLGVPGEELVVEHNPTLRSRLQEIDAPRKSKALEPNRERRDAKLAIHQAFLEMRRRLQDYARRLRERTKQRAALPVGKVMRISPDRQFGFLETPDGQDVYFHRNSVLGDHFDELRAGSPVRFALDAGEKGPQASTVRIARPRKASL